MKTCSKCMAEKQLGDFSKSKRNSDGLSSWCRDCHNESSKIRSKKIRLTEQGRARLRSLNLKWGKANRIKERARMQVLMAVKSGSLVRPKTCEVCGVGCNPHAHHENYAKPLVVKWLCIKCHGKRHREINLETVNK